MWIHIFKHGHDADGVFQTMNGGKVGTCILVCLYKLRKKYYNNDTISNN